MILIGDTIVKYFFPDVEMPKNFFCEGGKL